MSEGIRATTSALRRTADAVDDEWHDEASRRFRREIVDELAVAALALAAAEEAALEEVRSAERDL